MRIGWLGGKRPEASSGSALEDVRARYGSFKELLALNSESLEQLSRLQEDLQFLPPTRALVGARVGALFDKVEGVVRALGILSRGRFPQLSEVLRRQRQAVEAFLAAEDELRIPSYSAWLSGVRAADAGVVGGKAAMLGEVRNALGLPVPRGFVITTEAYNLCCGIPLWQAIRDEIRDLVPEDLDALETTAQRLAALVLGLPIPRVVEVAILERARAMRLEGGGFAVRSSAVGEGGERTFAGQFESMLNVPHGGLLDAYRRVLASRFSARALFYRAASGLAEVESPMAVLFLETIEARASGVLYTRDPRDPRSSSLWITSAWGLGMDRAPGGSQSDHFVVGRSSPHAVLERHHSAKRVAVYAAPGGGLGERPLGDSEAKAPSLQTEDIQILAQWGVLLEDHFKAPQDVEWVLDIAGNLWVLQSRDLTLGEASGRRVGSGAKGEPLAAGGRTVYPGRMSGPAHIVRENGAMKDAPRGSVVFVGTPTSDFVKVLPRIGGLVAERGSVTGHAACLLREFKVPSVFQMHGILELARSGDVVSLDAGQGKLYPGAAWPSGEPRKVFGTGKRSRKQDLITQRILNLNLLNPGAFNFRPRGCQSLNDVLRFSHEKAIHAMFEVSDTGVERREKASKRLLATVPLHLVVLDLGGGLSPDCAESDQVTPECVLSKPFQAIWAGLSFPEMTWNRKAPTNLEGLASVVTSSFSEQPSAVRPLGGKSYILVGAEYMNLNARMAYHFTLVDACLSDAVDNNHIAFRFAGGGAARWRRDLRACFVEECLAHYGFQVDRRGDLVNAWFRKGTAEETAQKLDILGRLLACSSQLDMFMTDEDAMKGFVEKFLKGDYTFE